MIKLEIWRTFGGIHYKENEIDITTWTSEMVSEVIVKQGSVYPGMWHKFSRNADTEKMVSNFVERLTK